MCNSVGKNGFLPPSKRHGVFDVFSKGGPKNTKKGLKTGQKHEKTAKKHEKRPKNSLKSRKNTPKTGHFRLFSKSVPEFGPKTAKIAYFQEILKLTNFLHKK